MTVFDAIRYPVSNQPTRAELEALPVAVYRRWIVERRFRTGNGVDPTPEQMAAWFRFGPVEAEVEAQRLRAMILEYDDDLPRNPIL